jgi:PAS domain S-box-containing protein
MESGNYSFKKDEILLLNGLPLAFQSLDSYGRFIAVNDKWLEILGYDRQEVIGHYFVDFISDEFKDSFKGRFEQFKKLGHANNIEFDLIRKDGSKISVTFDGRIIYGENGRVIRTHCIMNDISELKMAEKALIESEDRYRSLIRDSMDAIWYSTVDGKIADANDAAAKLLGLPVKSLIGMNILDFYVNPMDRLEFQKKVQKEGSIKEYEVKLKNKSGQHLSCLFTSSLWKDKKGNILGYRGIVHDITKRKKIEEMLRKSEEKYRMIVDHTSDLVSLIDLKGNCIFVSGSVEKHTGYKDFEIVGKNIKDFISQESYIEAMERIELRLKGAKELPRFEVEILSKTKEFIPFKLNTSPIYIDEKLISILIVARNITERKKAEEKINSLNEALRVLNKILRHDILNDLTVVMSACDMIKTGDERLKLKAGKAINKSVSLIEQMRELENALASDEGLSEKSLRNVVKKVVKNYPDVKFSITGDCTALCDEAIHSAIDNIVRNAVVHGKTDRIDISIQEKNGDCEMRIADYGKGIPPDLKDKIFEEGESFGETRGSGLGLYIVKKVIERYGGEISVEDNKPNGAVFILKFKK